MSGIPIHFTDLQKGVLLDRSELQAAARRALESEGSKKEVSLVYVDNEKIRELNRDYLGHDWETDVIAFPLEDDADALLGEVIVSTEVAIAEAAKRKRTPMEEVLLYTVHGVLHLLGYDDHTPEDTKRMRRKEAEIIEGS
ncbi:MAG: rRNA maturation RNase YbeY [Planctomycetota bacterium]|nr:rRNA maturation RNase YbeY [Planctomycetota bacterium]